MLEFILVIAFFIVVRGHSQLSKKIKIIEEDNKKFKLENENQRERIIRIEREKEKIEEDNKKFKLENENQREKIKSLNEECENKSERIIRIEKEKEKIDKQFEPWLEEFNNFENFKQNFSKRTLKFDNELDKRKNEVEQLLLEKTNIETIIKTLKIELSELEKNSFLLITGSYTGNEYNFENSVVYASELKKIKEEEKELIKNNEAIYSGGCCLELSTNEKFIKNFSKLILRAFNGECDGIFSKIKSSGDLEKYQNDIKKSYSIIEKLCEVINCKIATEYLDFKLREAELIYKYLVKKQAELDEQREIREQMREEEKARKEYEKTIKEAELEEIRYQKALEQVQKVMATKSEEEKLKYSERIAELERELEEAKALKERALSQAQLTKSGHVYVISNIGSFGENVYKIGMTRRLDPLDRVKELGDASVPFPFDVHAMIYSNDAPALENKLHKVFDDKRLNLINMRKEFFNVTLEEIEEEVKKCFGDFKLTKIAEAEQFRKSLKLKNIDNEKLN